MMSRATCYMWAICTWQFRFWYYVIFLIGTDVAYIAIKNGFRLSVLRNMSLTRGCSILWFTEWFFNHSLWACDTSNLVMSWIVVTCWNLWKETMRNERILSIRGSPGNHSSVESAKINFFLNVLHLCFRLGWKAENSFKTVFILTWSCFIVIKNAQFFVFAAVKSIEYGENSTHWRISWVSMGAV